ncbi:uncharacterized protein LY79DRAFT_191644 [Colletotrichum navitas]|uniref:Uncharacterized protein n=1 Tax=Colletotrichum navitas TaxID=681940 RepID=A0AAD8PJ60_9PEZI|nr:uncharacterized protein LY79DRAFT_191644 [Colletotrichum navitas]KAK1561583.1 hypothetical protein LY79DRAFT_191644 [Colletotrichum navitas]
MNYELVLKHLVCLNETTRTRSTRPGTMNSPEVTLTLLLEMLISPPPYSLSASSLPLHLRLSSLQSPSSSHQTAADGRSGVLSGYPVVGNKRALAEKGQRDVHYELSATRLLSLLPMVEVRKSISCLSVFSSGHGVSTGLSDLCHSGPSTPIKSSTLYLLLVSLSVFSS